MNKIYLLLGSNLSQPSKQLALARKKISAKATINEESSIYQTAAWGNEDQPDFLNQVIIVTSVLLPEEFLRFLLSIEQDMGRERSVKNAPRLIDIDILFFNRLIIEQKNLTIPHPRIADRRFVLIPLCELSPDFIHPVSNQRLSQLLINCKDTLTVKRYEH